MRNKAAIACVVPALLVLLFFMFAPEDRINSVSETYRRITNDPSQRCLDLVRPTLKNPDSARIVRHSIEDKCVIVRYKATNSYGAYVEGSTVCGSPERRPELQRIQDLGCTLRADLDAEIQCMRKKNALLQAGRLHDAERMNCK